MKIRIKKLHQDAVLPAYANPGDAGMDIFCLLDYKIKPNQRALIDTGISMEIPNGYVGLVWDKSGLAVKKGLKTMAGVIDSGYRGEIKIAVLNTSDEEIIFKQGEKVAQILIQKIENPEIEEVSELSDTQRGEGGFGSTGA